MKIDEDLLIGLIDRYHVSTPEMRGTEIAYLGLKNVKHQMFTNLLMLKNEEDLGLWTRRKSIEGMEFWGQINVY